MNKKLFLSFSIILLLMLCSKVWAGEPKVIHEKTFNTSEGKNLKISTSTGDIYISTWDKQEVSVKISGNKKAHDKVKFKFENNDDGVSIYAKKDSWFNFFNFSNVYLKYEVKIPAKYNAMLNTSGGDIKLYDLNGEAKVETSGGDIFLKNVSGKIYSSTSGGDVVLDRTKGNIDLSTSGGDIKVTAAEGSLKASTSGGDIRLNIKNGKVEASTSGGDIELVYLEKNSGIDLSTSGGDINVRVPSDFAANVDLSTTGGDVECDLPITSKGKFSATRLRGQVNGGGNFLHCETSGGDIKVTK